MFALAPKTAWSEQGRYENLAIAWAPFLAKSRRAAYIGSFDSSQWKTKAGSSRPVIRTIDWPKSPPSQQQVNEDRGTNPQLSRTGHYKAMVRHNCDTE